MEPEQTLQEITENLTANLKAMVTITSCPWGMDRLPGWDCVIQHDPSDHAGHEPDGFSTQTIQISVWDATLEGSIRRANETFLSALATGTAEAQKSNGSSN